VAVPSAAYAISPNGRPPGSPRRPPARSGGRRLRRRGRGRRADHHHGGQPVRRHLHHNDHRKARSSRLDAHQPSRPCGGCRRVRQPGRDRGRPAARGGPANGHRGVGRLARQDRQTIRPHGRAVHAGQRNHRPEPPAGWPGPGRPSQAHRGGRDRRRPSHRRRARLLRHRHRRGRLRTRRPAGRRTRDHRGLRRLEAGRGAPGRPAGQRPPQGPHRLLGRGVPRRGRAPS